MASYGRMFNYIPVTFKPKKPSINWQSAPKRKPKVYAQPKKAMSNTQTKTKQKRRNPPKGLPSDKGVSFFNYSFKSQRLPKSIYKQMIGNQQWLRQEGFQMKGGVGRQVVYGGTALAVGTQFDLQSIRDKIVPVVGGVRDPRTVRIFLRSARNVIHMRNQTNAPIKVKLFDIMTKRSPTSTTNNIPVNAWIKGIADDSGDGANHLLVGQMPGQSPEFRTYYRIVRERVLELQPGAFHEHFFKVNYNKMLSTTALDNLATGIDSLGGFTFYSMIVAYGSIGSDSASGTGAVTYLPVNLDVAYNKVYKYAYLEKNLPKYDIDATHSAPAANTLHSVVDGDFVAAALNIAT